MDSRFFLFVASLAVAPFAGALAQGNNPTGNQGSNQSITATPGTADTTVTPGSSAGHVNANHLRKTRVTSSRTPGATGRTIVPGDNSTIRSDRAATAEQKDGAQTR